MLSKWGGGAESIDVCEKEEDELVCEREGARELCYHQKLSWAFSLDSFFFFITKVDYYQQRYESACHTVCLSSVGLTLSLDSLLAAVAS